MIMLRSGIVVALIVIGATLLPSYARAQATLQGFKMPSDNVYCMIEPGYQGHPDSDLRCDIVQTDTPPPPAPASCRFSWGKSFAIDLEGDGGTRLCVSDTTRDDELPVLSYGTQWSQGGYLCKSATSGLTCSNVKAHGFVLSKEAQSLF